jgi:hypothetical protein
MCTDIEQISYVAKWEFVGKHKSEWVIDSEMLVMFVTLNVEVTVWNDSEWHKLM